MYFLTVPTIILANSGWAYGQNEELIARWVATQMAITKKYAIPIVQIVDKEELSLVFKAGSKQYMARWTADHGTSAAENLMGVYLNNAVGLFEPKSRVIYVGGFLPDCQRDAVLAHEIAHYFQYIFGGPVVGEGFAAEALLMEREIEASTIERLYEKQFCPGQGVALRP
jgi:hypothetical protein